jgi:hypothetical protein
MSKGREEGWKKGECNVSYNKTKGDKLKKANQSIFGKRIGFNGKTFASV